MRKPADPRELAVDLLPRSICLVQVAAVLADDYGIFSWGWNSVGEGLGEHAEHHCYKRANKQRIRGATLYVAARWKDGKVCKAKPCVRCGKIVKAYNLIVVYRDGDGSWKSG